MSPALLMVVASLLFASDGRRASSSPRRPTAPARSSSTAAASALLSIAALSRARGTPLRTPVPAMHFWRSLSGVAALCLWFYAIGGLPLATAMTLNYMSSVWMALFLIGGAVLLGASRIDARLVATVLVGFVGVA